MSADLDRQRLPVPDDTTQLDDSLHVRHSRLYLHVDQVFPRLGQRQEVDAARVFRRSSLLVQQVAHVLVHQLRQERGERRLGRKYGKCPQKSLFRDNKDKAGLIKTKYEPLLTRSVLRNVGLLPHGCDHAARRTRASFCELYCHCLGKHSQTETGFKTNFLPMKGENSTTSYCAV